MLGALVCGMAIALGAALAVRAAFPKRPPLAAELARLQALPGAPSVLPDPAWRSSIHPRLLHLSAGLASAIGVSPQLRRDLAITDGSHEQLVIRKLITAAVGVLLVPLMSVAMTLGGVSLPLSIPAVAAMAMGALGFVLPNLILQTEAAQRRRDFAHALSAFLDVVAIQLASGSAPEGALHYGAQIGNGWAFRTIAFALDTARIRGEAVWETFSRLGDELGVVELEELAASLSLAGNEGARVRESLTTKAESLRRHQLSQLETSEQRASERMSVPLAFMFVGFIILIGYPAIARVLAA